MKTITRSAEADWQGNLTEGYGNLTSGSQTLHKHPFSFNKRTESGDLTQTNPEELIAAALASCFSMALSKTLQDQSLIAQQLVIRADVTLRIGEQGPKVDELKLDVAGQVGGCTEEQFRSAVTKTQKSCPIYQLLEPGFGKIEVLISLRD